LRKRITTLEMRRDAVAIYLESEKALYLTILRVVMVTLVAIATGDGITASGDPARIGPVFVLSLFFYGLAVVTGIQGLKISELDSRAKVTQTVEKLNSEIADLKTKLGAMAK
jgi:hypothetical protein